ncbi:MAG: hypothetical protein ACFFBV_15985, partial [Promethearchaeota archaeon]
MVEQINRTFIKFKDVFIGRQEEIRNYIEVDSLTYLSMEGLLSSVPNERGGYCTACFNGDYPILPKNKMEK